MSTYNQADIAAQIAGRRATAEAQAAERKEGFKSIYIKLAAGSNTLRFLPSPEGEPLIIEFRQHVWQQPKFATGLDLEYLYRDENRTILEIAKRLGKIQNTGTRLLLLLGLLLRGV